MQKYPRTGLVLSDRLYTGILSDIVRGFRRTMTVKRHLSAFLRGFAVLRLLLRFAAVQAGVMSAQRL
jgi:hypothetical protein